MILRVVKVDNIILYHEICDVMCISMLVRLTVMKVGIVIPSPLHNMIVTIVVVAVAIIGYLVRMRKIGPP